MHQIHLSTPTGESVISVGNQLSSKLHSLEPRPILLVDENVLRHHGAIFTPFQVISLPSGEQHKTLHTVENIYRELVGCEADRSSLLVGVGGGLATDVAGFVASTYLREVQFGFISTTLLGQVDASIGGKNGVNLDGYKNMVGTIRQPQFVWCDLGLLRTLARREYVAGIAEVIKYGAIRDNDFLLYLGEHMQDLMAMEEKVLEKVVTTSVSIKVDIVSRDERESGFRRVLNFGHTFGHAIERQKKILHGEAVAIGMVLSARLSGNLGMLTAAEVDLLEKLVKEAGLPVDTELDTDEIYENIRKDKKRSGDAIHLVLLDGHGKAVIRIVPLKELKSIIHDLCSN